MEKKSYKHLRLILISFQTLHLPGWHCTKNNKKKYEKKLIYQLAKLDNSTVNTVKIIGTLPTKPFCNEQSDGVRRGVC